MEIQPKRTNLCRCFEQEAVSIRLTSNELDKDKVFLPPAQCKGGGIVREANIPLQAGLSVMQQQFGVISGVMTVEINRQEYHFTAGCQNS